MTKSFAQYYRYVSLPGKNTAVPRFRTISFLPRDNYNMDQGSRVEKESKALTIIRIYSPDSTRAGKCS